MTVTHTPGELIAVATFALEVSQHIDDTTFGWMISVEEAAAPNSSATDTIHELIAGVSAFVLRSEGILWGETHDRWMTADAVADLVVEQVRSQASELHSVLAAKALDAGKL